MKNTWFWLIAVAAILALSGTTRAGSPAMTMLLLPQLFGQEPSRNAPLPATSPRTPVLAQPDLLTPRERTSPEPGAQTTRYPNGWYTIVNGPHIVRWACGKPFWLYQLDGY